MNKLLVMPDSRVRLSFTEEDWGVQGKAISADIAAGDLNYRLEQFISQKDKKPAVIFVLIQELMNQLVGLGMVTIDSEIATDNLIRVMVFVFGEDWRTQ